MSWFVWLLPLFLSACLCEDIGDGGAASQESTSDEAKKLSMDPDTFRDILPTYTYEYRSSNPRDTKFTSGGIYQASLREDYGAGSSVKCDLKMGVYSFDESTKIDFFIVKGNEDNRFRTIIHSERERDFVFMDIKTNAQIDREAKDGYLLEVIARDARTLVSLDMTLVNVTILDSNDNNPQFIIGNRTQIVSVKEDIPLHSSILKLTAVDRDIGMNGLVYYSFKGKTSSFAINPVTGQITTTRALNSSRPYQLRVVARDRGPPATASPSWHTCIVHVNVQPVNKFAPQVRIKSSKNDIPEGNTGVGIVCAEVKIVDKDNGDNGRIDKLVITSGNSDRNFAVRIGSSSNEFKIEVVRPLDREKQPFGYNLTLVAFDKGIPQLNGSFTLRVLASDVNDMAPEFDQSKYSAIISELAPPHTPVVHIKATDGDLGINADIAFAIIQGNDDGNFSIDPQTGIIYTASWLDYEWKASFDLVITAINGAQLSIRQMSSVPVHIEVQDGNNKDPVFTQSSYEKIPKILYETLSGGKTFLTVTATDEDSGDNGRIQYHIMNEEPVPFTIDPASGAISTTAKLNRDEGLAKFITLKVRASDMGEPLRRETETYVHITVMAMDNNAPVFKQYSCDVRVSDEAPTGTAITTLTAVDIDIESTSHITYGFAVPDRLFEVDPSSGEVKTKRYLQASKSETLILEAKHGLHRSAMTLNIDVVPRQQAKQFVNFVQVVCKDNPAYMNATQLIERQKSFTPSQHLAGSAPRKPLNQRSPHFLRHTADISLKEDAPSGTVVVRLTAIDADQGYNGRVAYSITDGGNVGNTFTIDMFSGIVTTSAPLDREKTPEYTLSVTAYDGGSPSKSVSTSVRIIITDINDNSPVFNRLSYKASILENATVGQSVLHVQATDVDKGVNGVVKYLLADNFGKFDIDENGLITLMAEVDHEEAQYYDILVQALDSSPTAPRISSASVSVKIGDINDTPPKITPAFLNLSIPEDLPTDSVITSIHAVDPDKGQGGKLSYALLSGGNKFRIDSKSGVVRLRRKLDYSAQDTYNLTVRVSDHGSPVLYSECHIIVALKPVEKNSNAPEFQETGLVLQTSVLENQPEGTPVEKVLMSSSTGPVKYALVDGTGMDKFSIRADTGLLVTTTPLDHEEADHYWLVVQAKAGDVQRLHANIHVLITVLDVRDEGPYFNPAVYHPLVLENQPSGTSVVHVKAHDPNSADSKLTYSIMSGNEQGYFAINQSGLITTTAPLDRETDDKFTLEVYVSDISIPPRNTSVIFTVTVSDANDNPPEFVQSSFDVALLNLSTTGNPTEILQLVATDDDSGTNGELTYTISRNSQNTRLFAVDSRTGLITAKQRLPFDSEFSLTVNVSDGGHPSKTAVMSVNVMFWDANVENSRPPVLLSPQDVTVQIAEDAPINSHITTVHAEDPDYDFLFLSIVSGNVDGTFWMDSSSGFLYLAKKLDYEKKQKYVLKLEVTDGFNSVTATITIHVTDVNDNVPRPVMMEYRASVPEDAFPGTLVTTVEGELWDLCRMNIAGKPHVAVGAKNKNCPAPRNCI